MFSLPFMVIATGIPSFSASSTSSARASEAVTPPPATITGRSAFASIASARSTAPASGGIRYAGNRVYCSSIRTSNSPSPATSSPSRPGNSRCTGPGVPVVAVRNA